MASYSHISMAAIATLLLMLVAFSKNVESIGVCYGQNGDNLPQPSDVVSLYKANNIGAMRIYGPDQATLQALQGSNINLILDVPNPDLQNIASDPSAAATWVQNNIQAYSNVAFKYIAVGNEVIPGGQAQYVLPAMNNIQSALTSIGLQSIKVSTSVSTGVLGNSYPPSAGSFSSDASASLGPIIQFLASNGCPLLVNVYPYFSYVGNIGSVDLSYALFNASRTVVQDGQNAYNNLFDAIVDAVYSALESTGGSNVPIVVSESGWPSADGTAATVSNAQRYNSNLIKHVGKGTPKRPGGIETYIFGMFNEDLKQPQGVENNFGLFYPNQQHVYPINFNSTPPLRTKNNPHHSAPRPQPLEHPGKPLDPVTASDLTIEIVVRKGADKLRNIGFSLTFN